MVKLHFGILVCVSGWSQSPSKFGTCKHVQHNFSAVAKDSSMSINRVTWSPDGDLIGVAFTKHLIHLHAYQQPNETRQVLEIEAHSGGVNDIAFSRPNKQLCVVTCGDDKLIRVWDMHGQKIYSFKGHEAPV